MDCAGSAKDDKANVLSGRCREEKSASSRTCSCFNLSVMPINTNPKRGFIQMFAHDRLLKILVCVWNITWAKEKIFPLSTGADLFNLANRHEFTSEKLRSAVRTIDQISFIFPSNSTSWFQTYSMIWYKYQRQSKLNKAASNLSKGWVINYLHFESR